MEYDLKISKVEYLSNHLLDHTQILSLCLDDQIIFYKYFKIRQTSMEEYIKWNISATSCWIMLKF